MTELLVTEYSTEPDDVLKEYDREMDKYLEGRVRNLGGAATAFEMLARPVETVAPIEAARYTGEYTTGPDNRGVTHPDYSDVVPDSPRPR